MIIFAEDGAFKAFRIASCIQCLRCEFRQAVILCMVRSSHWRCSRTKVVLKNFAKSKGKHLFRSIFFNKAVGLNQLYQKGHHDTKCFSVRFSEVLRAPFLQTFTNFFAKVKNTSGRLLLHFGLFYITVAFILRHSLVTG